MANQIVTIDVSSLTAPAPITLQQTGAFIAQGATTLAAGVPAILTQASDLTQYLRAPQGVGLTWSGGVVTATTISTTITSGTYNAGTGLVTLNLAAALSTSANTSAYVTVSGATGTGAFASIDGSFTVAINAPTGTIIEYFIATGLTMTISGGNVAVPHNVPSGSNFVTTIAGAAPAGYNGTFLATSTGADTFTYAVAATLTSPATGTPTFTPFNQNELVNRVTAFFSQGTLQSVYVIDFGGGTPAAGVTARDAYIAAPFIQPNGQALQIYIWAQPGTWATESTAPTSAAAQNADGSLVYFVQPVNLSTYTNWVKTPPLKSVLTITQSTQAPLTESVVGAVMFKMLTKGPSSATNKSTPLAYNALVNVTPYGPTPTQAATLQAANVNYVDTGAEGGISNAILKLGKMMDGNDFQFWYNVDWVNLNEHQALANVIINGNNNPLNPIVYNQAGINTLKATAQGVINNGVTFGTVNNATPVAAISFTTYTTQNPSDYAAGRYNGLSVIITPQIGFLTITFNLQVSSFGVAGQIPTQ